MNEYPADTPILTREDACRFASGTEARGRAQFMKNQATFADTNYVDFAKAMQADGALFAIWRHGIGCTQQRLRHGMILKNEGLSVMHWEGSQPGDRNDLDEKRLLDQLDSWMQSNGLRRLEND